MAAADPGEKLLDSPVLPSTDTEVLRFWLLVATVIEYCLPGVSTLKVHSLMFDSTSLVSTVVLPVTHGQVSHPSTKIQTEPERWAGPVTVAKSQEVAVA